MINAESTTELHNSKRLFNIFKVYFDNYGWVVQPLKNEMRSALSLEDGIPLKAIALPGANPEGLVNHLLRLPSDHLRVALDDKAPE